MPYYNSGDVRLYYEEEGKGVPLIFVHGFTIDRRMWNDQREFFKDDFRVILPDSRGHGKSDCPESGYSRTDRVRDLVALVDHLEIEKCHLVGLSMGGVTAIGFALDHQDRLKSLTLVSSGAAGYKVGLKIDRLDDIAREESVEAAKAEWIYGALRWFKDNKPGKRELAEFLRVMMEEHSGAIWGDKMRGKYPRLNDMEKIGSIDLPTLIIAGEQDKMFLPVAKALHKGISNSRLLKFPATGHMVNMEQPERFNQELQQFLRELT